jgi:hypothetical protein
MRLFLYIKGQQMLFSKTTESRFAVVFVLAKKHQIEKALNVYKSDSFLPEIIESLKQAQQYGIKLQDETPSGLEKIYLLL